MTLPHPRQAARLRQPASLRAGFAATLLGLVALLALFAPAASQAGEQTIVIREQLNRAYGRELVFVPFSADFDTCRLDSLRLVGPQGPIPVQVVDAVFWPKDFDKFTPGMQPVKTAKLAFVVEGLAPLATATYTLSYDGKQAAAPVASDLTISKSADTIELSTKTVGVRFAATISATVGPVAALRVGDGPWAGGSALTGELQLGTTGSTTLADSGPVFARVEATYTAADGSATTLTATVIHGDGTIRWRTSTTGDMAAAALRLQLPAPAGVTEAVLPHGYGQWFKNDRKTTVATGEEPFTFLTPNSSLPGIFADSPSTVQLTPATGGTTLQIASREPGTWVTPQPMTYAGFEKFHLRNIDKMWEAWRTKRIPLRYSADGQVTLDIPFVAGERVWWTGGTAPVGDTLDSVNREVLDWEEDPADPAPRLFTDLANIKDVHARAATDEALKATLKASTLNPTAIIAQMLKAPDQRKPKDVDKAITDALLHLAQDGGVDIMRKGILAAGRYDILVNSGLLTPEQRQLVRAQMAHIGYLLADPMCWDMERGYLTGNPNMTLSYTLTLGIVACTLRDHPAAPAWADRATRWMNKWLDDDVGPNGEWLPEGMHYGHVSLEPLVTYAIAAKRAGFHDFRNDERLKRVLTYFAKYNSPADPRRNGARSINAFGRGHGGQQAIWGAAAAFYKDSDPALSATMQWLWAANDYPMNIPDYRMAGLEPYYFDRRLPAKAPEWGSELFPTLGVMFRHGFETPNEGQLNALLAVDSERNLDIWTPEIGGISSWFDRGAPLSTTFTFEIGYKERHELLRNGVLLARNWGAEGDPKLPFGHYNTTKLSAYAAFPGADYARSTITNTTVDDRDWFPKQAVPAYPRVTPATGNALTWTRQLLYVKNPDPSGAAYLVMRDTTSGGQPTAWQFWTLSEKLGSTKEAADREAFLADAPGKAVKDARPLPDGARYTAIGQHGVDVEYYVASPSTTPRSTLRYGGTWTVNKIPEYQDLLHLQLPGDGVYYVIAYPRPRGETAPTFSSLADGAILKVDRPGSVDYSFLATEETEVMAEDVHFKGSAGSIQRHADGTMILTLAAAGEVAVGDYSLTGDGPAELHINKDGTRVSIISSPAGGTFTVHAKPGLGLQRTTGLDITATTALKLKSIGGVYHWFLPAGVTRVDFGATTVEF